MLSGFGAHVANNCYNLGKVDESGDYGYEFGGTDMTINKCYYSSETNDESIIITPGLIDIADKSLDEFVELLNSYRQESTDGDGNTVEVWPSGWKHWKAGENSYPVFDE